MIKDIFIRSSLRASAAESFIREIIGRYQDENTSIVPHIMIENSTLVGAPKTDIYYTVIVTIFDKLGE